MKTERLLNQLLVIAAALLLLVPAALTNRKADQISQAENRRLAEPVPLSEGLSAFAQSLDACANDRIGLREEMAGLYSEITVNLLRTHHSSVLLGKDGWLFYRDELPDYTGQTNTPENIELCVQVIRALDRWCKDRGSQLVFLVCPNKSTVYSQYMPEYIRQADTTLLDSVAQQLAGQDILFLNPKARLIADAHKKELYCKLDTHWNPLGARYALEDLVQALGLPEKEFALREYRENSGDLLSMLHVPDVGSDSLFAEVAPSPACTVESFPDNQDLILHNEGGTKFLCFRDSFSISLADYYTHYFDGPMYWSWNVPQAPVESYPPYVIVECVERYLLNAVYACYDVLESA